MLVDAHCHLGWFADPVGVARRAGERDLGLLAVTVTPGEFARLHDELARTDNVMVAAGLHPWWVRVASDADALVEILPGTRFVGEIGLDGSRRYAGSWDAQLEAFERICAAAAASSDPAAPKVLSVHAVRSAGTVLDVLERTGAAATCRCVLHWFSGSCDELWRAVRLGCAFSLGEHSLATGRGREYARVLPADRLLCETDLPESEGSLADAGDVAASLCRAVEGIAAARGLTSDEARTLLAGNLRVR